MKSDNLLVAITSFLCYFILLIMSSYQYYIIKNRKIINNLQGKFTNYKLIFLSILSISAILSLPLWGICIILGGPNDCQWESRGYAFCWSLHLIALVGYSCSIGIPTIMWSDIINGFDHQSFLSSFTNPNIDLTRICFLSFVCCYAVLEFVTILSMAIYMSPYHMNEYFEKNSIYKLSILLEPFIISLFAGGCLVIGIRLQLYVRKVRFNEHVQRKLLFQLNTVLVIVTICYMLRAILVFDLRKHFLPFKLNYITWIICTHWAPQVICSFCLLILMTRSKGNENGNGNYYSSIKYQNLLESRNSPNQLTSPNSSGSTSPLLRSYNYSDYNDDYDNYDNYDNEYKDNHRNSNRNRNRSRSYSRDDEDDLFYNQEVNFRNNNNNNNDNDNHDNDDQNEYHLSPSTSPSHLSHNYSIYNPYVMSNDDSNESVISDDIVFVNVQQGFNEFGNILYDGIGIE